MSLHANSTLPGIPLSPHQREEGRSTPSVRKLREKRRAAGDAVLSGMISKEFLADLDRVKAARGFSGSRLAMLEVLWKENPEIFRPQPAQQTLRMEGAKNE